MLLSVLLVMATFASLQSPEAVEGRILRNAKIVVWAEMPNGNVAELDADDWDHATVLATTWVEKVGAEAASIHYVRPTGKTRCVEVITPERDWLD